MKLNVVFQLTATVSHLEVLCKQLYESQSASERSEAEKALVTFQNAPDGLDKCQMLLERANSPYSQLLATTTLTKLVSRTAQVLSLQQRIDIRKLHPTQSLNPQSFSPVPFAAFSLGNYVLQYLYSRPKLATFVVQGLVTLFARITKLGWFDSSKETENFVFRNVIADVTKFLQVKYPLVFAQFRL